MNAREFAERMGVDYTTVARWLKRNLIPGAKKRRVGPYQIWDIPARALKMKRPKSGRKSARKGDKQ